MTITEAKTFVGKDCLVFWRDRFGIEQSTKLYIEALQHMSPYGTYLIGCSQDICLDKVTRIDTLNAAAT